MTIYAEIQMHENRIHTECTLFPYESYFYGQLIGRKASDTQYTSSYMCFRKISRVYSMKKKENRSNLRPYNKLSSDCIANQNKCK